MQYKTHQLARIIIFCTISLIIPIMHPYFNNPYSLPKNSVLLIAATFGMLCLLNNRFTNLNSKNLRIWISSILFVLVMSCLTLFSDDKYVAFFGRYSNPNGLLKYLCLLILFLLAVFSFRTVDAIILLNLLSGLGALTAIYGFFQYLGIDFIQYESTNTPIIATLGNSNFASSLIGISSISLLWNIISSKTKFIRFTLILLLLFQLYVLKISESSQGIFILVCGVFSMTGFLIFKKFHKLKVAYLSFGLFSGAATILGFLQIGPLNQLVYQPSITYRGDYYRAGWNMFKSNIFFGVGIDQYSTNYREFRDLDAALRLGPRAIAGNSHNYFLELLATGGVFLFLAYCVFLLNILISIKNGYKKFMGPESLVFFTLASCWLGFQVHTLVSPESVPIQTIGWVLSGALIALELNKENIPNASLSSTLQQKKANKNFSSGLLTKVAVFIILILDILFLVPNWQAEYNLKLAKDIRNSPGFENKLVEIESLAQSVTEKNDFEPLYQVEKALLLYSINQKELARDVFKSVIESDPQYYDAYTYLSQVYENLNMPEQAIDVRIKMTNLDKYDTDNWLSLAKNFAEVGRYGEIKKIINLAEEKGLTLLARDLKVLLGGS